MLYILQSSLGCCAENGLKDDMSRIRICGGVVQGSMGVVIDQGWSNEMERG